MHLFLEVKDVKGVKAASRCLKVSQHFLRLDPCVVILGMVKVADVDF